MSAGGPQTPSGGIEAAKLAGSVGIIAFHEQTTGASLGYAGLPLFAMLTAALAARSARGRDWPSFRRGRLRRLLLPWLVWSGFYAAVQCSLAAYAGAPAWSWLHPSALAMGGYPHLWYLPFAAVTTLAVGRCGARGPAAAWLAAGALALPLAGWLATLPLPQPAPQWLFVLPAAVLGTALARAPLGGGGGGTVALAIAAGAGGCALAWACGLLTPWPQYLLAVPMAAAAWALPLRAPRWLGAAGAATFGVYVFHPFVKMLLALLAVHGGVAFTEASLLAAIFAGALLLTLALRLTPARALL